MSLGHRHRYAAGEDRAGLQSKYKIGRPAQYCFEVAARTGVHVTMRTLGRRSKYDRRTRNDDKKLQHRVVQHRLPPPAVGDGTFENRRPDRPGEETTA